MGPSFASLLTAGLSFTSLVAAAPSFRPRSSNNVFTVEQVKNEKFTRNGPLALAKVYKKYGATLPDDLAAAVKRIKGVSRRDSGSATTSPTEDDSEWLTPVQIGTPAKTFNLDFDTGSSDLWVFSSSLSSSSGHTVYDASQSNTSKKLTGESWSISYGDGSSSSGDVYKDVVTIGGLTVESQAVEAATTVSDEFSEETDLDGLLGLGFSSINTVTPDQQKTFFDNAKSELATDVFTVDLRQDAAGKYNFGFINASAYTGQITYTDVDSSEGYWGFTSSGYAVGSGTFSSDSISAIADTGTTLLMLPDTINQAYYSQIDSAEYSSSVGGYVFSCDADIPSFTFGIGDVEFTIPSDYMNYAEVSTSYGKRDQFGGDFGSESSGSSDFGEESDDGYGGSSGGFGQSSGQSSTMCYGGLQPSDSVGINIFGDIALKATFVVFDGANTKLGWAKKTL